MKDVKISDFVKPTIITAQQYGTKVSVEIDHSDTDISELFDAFKTICIGLGYSETSWNEYIVDTAAEYREDESEYLKEKFTEWEREGEDSEINLSHSNQHWNDESSTFDWDSNLSDGWDYDENDYNFVEPVPEPNDNLKKAAAQFNKKIMGFNKKVKGNKK
jgi:hypothetical protein